MRVLYHWPLDPESRQARIALAEKNLKFKLEAIDIWSPQAEFLHICAEGIPPCLTDIVANKKVVISGARAICEYANDGSSRYPLMSSDTVERAEARRISDWFNRKFSVEVNAYILYEKVEKSLTGTEAPSPPVLREGREYLQFHLDYISWLLEKRDWLAGRDFSLADITAGAHISCLDFVGEINWKNYPDLKDWYQKFKSRPSVRPLLADRIPGLIVPRHYSDLDF